MALSAFEKEFKAARDAGKTEFDFGGKKYTTKYKEEAEASSKPAAKKSQSTPREAAIAEANDLTSPPPKRSGGIGPYNIGAGPTEEEKQAAYDRYAENRKKMGDSGSDDSGSKPIAESDWAKSVRAAQAASPEGGMLGKRMRAALGSSYKKGGSVSSASKRADGCAQRGKTKGRMI